MRPRILVAIPAYRCAGQIGRVLDGFTPSLVQKLDRIVVIENRSPDGTLEAAMAGVCQAKLERKAAVLRNRENYGLGGSQKIALREGIAGGFDWVAILHGDDQAIAAELEPMLALALARPECDAVLGARFMRTSRLEGYSLSRRAGNVGLNVAYSLLTRRLTLDLGSGLNLFRLARIDLREVQSFSDSFTFNMDLLLHLYAVGAKVRFFPITWRETDQVSNASNLRVGWGALRTLLRWRLGLARVSDASPRRIDEYLTEETAA